MMPGGLTEARPATEEIQKIADKVSQYTSGKSLIQNKFSEFDLEFGPTL